MFARNKKLARADCDHHDVVTIRNPGIERTVCESCGRVSIAASEGLSGSVQRSQFERDAERPRQTVG